MSIFMKPANYIYYCFLLVTMLFISSCGRSSFVAHSDIDRTVDYSKYTTFTLAEIPPAAGNEILHDKNPVVSGT